MKSNTQTRKYTFVDTRSGTQNDTYIDTRGDALVDTRGGSRIGHKPRRGALYTMWRRTLIMLCVLLSAIPTLSACLWQNGSTSDGGWISSSAPTSVAAVSEPVHTENRLEKILATDEVIVATSPDFAVMEFIDNRKSGQEQYVGIDPWFAKYIADELGVKLKIVAANFSDLSDLIKFGEADLIMSGLARNEKREELFELSDYYNASGDEGQGLIVLKKTLKNYQKAADFKGKKVAVVNESSQYNLLKEQLPDAIPELVEHINDGVMLLLKKEVVAIGIEGAEGLAICENYPDLAMAGFKYDYEIQGNVIAMQKGETELCARINEIIDKAASENKFDEWLSDATELSVEIGWQN